MSEARYHPLEAILRMCAAAAPQSWHYRVYAKEAGVDPEQLVSLLEWLWLEGLVQKAPGSSEAGPGVTLTELGKQVVEDPEALRRLCAGQPVREGDVGATIRNSLRQRTRPFVTQLIVLANVIVFAVGAWLATKRPGLFSAYLAGLVIPPGQVVPLNNLWHQLGGLTVMDLIRGEWWRMITATFVHAGFLHIGMNMYGLWAVGSFVERTWGHWRLFVIYFLSAWGGSCLAMTYSSALIGASGAVCGVLGAEAMWILLYGRYLPRNMARAGRSQMVTSIVLIVFISLMPSVSWQGHLGGGIAGAATALVLHFQRFGPRVFRVLGVIALIPIPWASYAWMERTRATSKTWLAAEMHEFNEDQIPPISRATREAFKLYSDRAKPLLERHALRRDEAETKEVVEALQQVNSRLTNLSHSLKGIGPYRDKQVEQARTTALDYVNALADACQETVRCLQAGKEWKRADEKQLEQKWQTARDSRGAWESLFKR